MVYKLQTAVSIQIKLMSMKIAIAHFFLITMAASLCVFPSQPDGQCTECGPLDVLINGTCYVKIRGCLRHSAGPICQQCQFGYVLSKQTCIREAIFFNNTNITFIPPVKIIPNPTLTFQDIRNKLGEQWGPYFSDAHEYFLSRYSQLGKGNIKNVDRLETKKGVFLVIEYQNQNSTRFEAVSFTDFSTNAYKQWSFGPISAQRKDPWMANNQTRTVLGDRLKDYFLYDFRQQGDIYILSYMNTKNEVIRVTLNRNDLVPSPISQTKLDIKNLSITDIFFQQFVKQFPSYSNSRMTSIQKYDDFYVVNLGPTITVSFRFINYRFLINKPIQANANVYNATQTQVSNSGAPLDLSVVGGYQNFTNYTDLRFQGSAQFAARQFPEIIGASVMKVQSQVVSGMLFIINYKKTPANSTIPDDYEMKVWYTIQNLSVLVQGRKNGNLIYNEMHNYNLDPVFLANYRSAQNASKVVNVPPIDSVVFKLLGTRKLYKVIFSPKEFLEFDYIPETNKANLLSYYVDGENIVSTLSSARNSSERRTPEVLFNFLATQNPVVARGKIQEIVQSLPSYILTVVTNNGTYKGVIEDKGGEMNITQFLKVSEVICYDMSVSEIQNSQKIKTIDQFLKNNYPIVGFNIQLVQVNVQPTSYVYRFLYASPKLKQIEIQLEEIDNIANVIKATYVNFGYEVVDPLPTNQDYQKITAIIKNSDLAGPKIPFFTEVNGSVIKSYYDDGKSTSEVYYDKILDKASAIVVSTRPYLLLPDGFNLDTLIYPPTPSPALNATLTKITQEALKKYTIVIRDGVLVFADKKNYNYMLMYKNTYGYQKLDATVDDLGNVVLGKLIITGYKDTDFSNCVKFSLLGKCLSCDPETEVQYQGGCHKKLEGCLIQPGAICIKCNANYVKSANNCYKQCSPFFK